MTDTTRNLILALLALSGCSHAPPKEDLAVTHPELYAPVHDVITTHVAHADHNRGRTQHKTVGRCLDQEGLWIKGCQ